MEPVPEIVSTPGDVPKAARWAMTMVAGNVDGGCGHEFPQGLLRPVDGFGKRRAGHSDADVLIRPAP